ncbi:MAG TPA: TIM barrel protein [Bacteroidales bacterium]|nr:TIM barrel protein [Bacteroidales bacterium]
MKSSRRTFLKTGAMAMAAAAILREKALASSAPAKRIVGLQLYSVRDEMEKDPLETLKQLAAMGYVWVEHANYVDRKFYGYEAKEFKKILDDLGLKMVSGHTTFGLNHWDDSKKSFTAEWMNTLDDAATLRQQYVVSPWMDEKMRDSYDNLSKYLDIFNQNGKLCMERGMKFGYHNHDFEFSQKFNDKSVFDIMMEKIDPKRVVIQLDIGNLYNGGAVALDVVKKFPGRFELLHVKDEIKATEGEEKYVSCILGEGIVDCRNVVDLATKIGGANVYIIEQESYQGKKPMDCVKEDLAVMKKWGYV